MDNNLFVNQFSELPSHLCPICGKVSQSASQICSEHTLIIIVPSQGGRPMSELEQAMSEYREAMQRMVEAVKLTAFHTKEAADAAKKAGELALLTSYHVKEYLNGTKDRLVEERYE